jgi:hypothetical protein
MGESPDGSDAANLFLPAGHLEWAESLVTGLPVSVECECPLGQDHTFADWVARFGMRSNYIM